MQIADLHVLIAGCGSISKRHAQVLRGLGVTHLSACDPSEESRAGMHALLPDVPLYGDFTEALDREKPDAAFILTPTKLHIPMAMQAIRAGCHVLIEKPLANTPEGVDALKTLAKANGRQVMVAFCFRYHEALCKAKAMADGGRIGRLVSIRAMMGEPFYDIHPDYMNLYYSKYSGAFELVHDLDLAIWFAGQDIQSVQGVYGSFSDMGMDSPDTVEMLLRFEDRCVANVHLDFFQTPRRRQIDLIGTKGVITVTFASWDEAEIAIFTRETMCWETQAIATRRDDMFAAEDLEFLQCILTGAPVRCTVDEALKSLTAIASIYRPLETEGVTAP